MIKTILSKISNMYKRIVFLIKHKNCNIHRTVKFKNINSISLGNNCNIGENSYLYCWKSYRFGNTIQDLNGTISIGDNFNATRKLTIQSCGKVKIGDNVLIASNVFICDYNHGIDARAESYLNNMIDVKHVEIGDGVWIGQGAIILGSTTIGEKSIVAAGSIVTKDVPAYCMVAGNPAKVIKKLDLATNSWTSKEEEI